MDEQPVWVEAAMGSLLVNTGCEKHEENKNAIVVMNKNDRNNLFMMRTMKFLWESNEEETKLIEKWTSVNELFWSTDWCW